MVDARNVTSGCTFRLITPSSGAVPAIHHGWNRVFPMHFLNNFALGHQPCWWYWLGHQPLSRNHVALYCVINCFSRFFSSNNCWFTFFPLRFILIWDYKKVSIYAQKIVVNRDKKLKTKKWDDNFHSVWKWPKMVSFFIF